MGFLNSLFRSKDVPGNSTNFDIDQKSGNSLCGRKRKKNSIILTYKHKCRIMISDTCVGKLGYI